MIDLLIWWFSTVSNYQWVSTNQKVNNSGGRIFKKERYFFCKVSNSPSKDIWIWVTDTQIRMDQRVLGEDHGWVVAIQINGASASVKKKTWAECDSNNPDWDKSQGGAPS